MDNPVNETQLFALGLKLQPGELPASPDPSLYREALIAGHTRQNQRGRPAPFLCAASGGDLTYKKLLRTQFEVQLCSTFNHRGGQSASSRGVVLCRDLRLHGPADLFCLSERISPQQRIILF